MELAFSDRTFRDLCHNESLANETFGKLVASKLKRILADLYAVSVVQDLLLLPGKPRRLNDATHDIMAIDIIDGYMLTFQAGHNHRPALPSGETDWSRVKRIKILGMERTHE